MKTTFKVFSIIAAFCIILGIIFIIAGLFMGANIFEAGKFMRFQSDDEFYQTYDTNFVDSIEVELSYGQLRIKRGESGASGSLVELSAINIKDDWFDVTRENGKLTIKDRAGGGLFGGRWHLGPVSLGYEPIINIVIPPGEFSFDGVKINAGAGELDIDDLSTETLNVELGAGSTDISGLKAERLKLSGGVGESRIKDAFVDTAEISSGVGKIVFEGVITNGGDISSGVGSIDLEISGKREDYGFDVETGLGECRINGDSFRGYHEPNADITKRFDLECGVGSIDMDFVE
ncbi:MAG TPA: hypothetical protein DEQ02_05320 [Ruminococcaceae bacterium]|nr:hypothetical protein [Oscillospiraceae bacterium]